MHLIKPTSLGLSFRPMEYRKRFGLCVSGYLHVPFVQAAGGTLWGEQSMWNFLAQEMAVPQIDEGISKLTPEFLVHGFAYPDPAHPQRNAVAVRVRLGTQEKTVLAFGDRRWDGDRISAPAAFERIALDWQNAYGGPGYPDNPAGKGRVAVDGVKWLPNLEAPDSRLLGRRDTVRPAAFAALDAMHPQRAALCGTYDDTWFKEHSPGFAPDLNWKHFNQARSDQWMSLPLRGDESFELHNLHPQRPLIQGNLPALCVRTFVRRRSTDPLQAPGKLREVGMRLTTVWFFPHAERMVLVFHGLAECEEDDGADLDLLLGAVDRIDPALRRDDGHFLQAIDLRTRSADAELHSLRQSDLLPQGLDTFDPAFEDLVAAAKPAGRKEDAALWRGQLDMQMARHAIAARGQDPDAMGLRIPQRQPQPTLDELPEILIRQRKQMADQQWEAIDQLLRRHEQIREQIESGTYDPATAVHRGPPQLVASASLAAMEKLHTESAEPFDRKLYKARFEVADAMRKLQYLQGAHEQAPALPQSGQAAQSVRAEVLWMLSRDFRSWKGFDFTGADLSNLDLRGIDLSEAWLESANFENSNLSRAKFEGAVLAHASFRGAVAVGTDFSGANLGGALLDGALLERANLEGAILNKAHLVGATLRRAHMAGLQVLETRCERVDWGGAQAAGVTFYRLDLRGCSFAGADLSSCLFVECDLLGVDFRDARMAGVSVNASRLAGAVLVNADLSGAVFSGATDLSRADFAGARAPRANFGDSMLSRTCWIGAQIDDAVLAGVDLSESDLSRASLQRALLRKSKLRGCKLESANLMEALMQRADLRGADLRDAQLFGVDLSRVRLDGDTRFDGAQLDRARTYPRLTPAQQAQTP